MVVRYTTYQPAKVTIGLTQLGIATSGFLTALECIEFVFNVAPDPNGGTYSAPQTPSWFN